MALYFNKITFANLETSSTRACRRAVPSYCVVELLSSGPLKRISACTRNTLTTKLENSTCGVASQDGYMAFQIGASLYAVGRPVQKRNEEDGQIGTNQSLPLERGALFNLFFGKAAHGPPHVAGGASGPIGGCRDESRTDYPDLDLRHVFDINNRKTDLI